MEEMDAAYTFNQEMNNNPKPKILETISSWLELEDDHPNFHLDLQMLDEHFFQFSTTNNNNNNNNRDYSETLLSNLPEPDSQFILDDLHEFDNPLLPPPPPPPPLENIDELPPITQNSYLQSLTIIPEPDECDTFLNVMVDTPQSIAVNQFFQSDDMIIMSNSSSSTNEIDYNHQLPMNIIEANSSSAATNINKNTESPGGGGGGDDDDDEEEEVEDEQSNKKGTLNCKNLVSERNRRKRLGQQLLALRSLVPNITKMDKRSVLVDALSYLKSMQEETARLQKELKDQPHLPRDAHLNGDDDDEFGDSAQRKRIRRKVPIISSHKPKPQIIEVDIEKMEEKRFIVKITCKVVNAIGGDVLRVIESLGFEITYASLDQIKPHHILTTIFIKVKKQEKMTEEKLKDNIINSAVRSGLTLLQSSC